MKKNLWMLGMAVMALTSCTQSEVLDVPESRVIGFDSFVGKETRADVVNDDAFNSFYVYCAKGSKSGGTFASDDPAESYYMNKVEVTRTNTSTVWTYDAPKEWIINKYYRFAAYSNGNKSTPEEAVSNNVTNVTFDPNMTSTVKIKGTGDELVDQEVKDTWGFTFQDYEASDKDLVVATSVERNTVQANSGQASVNLSFAHMLAKVQFKFSYYSEDTEQTTVKIMPFKMNAVKTADLDVFHKVADNTTYANWSSQYVTPTSISTTNTSTTDYSLGDYTYFPSPEDQNGTVIQNHSIFYNNYVIPQKNNFSISGIIVEIYKGDSQEPSSRYTYNDVSLHINGHEYWRPGYIYRYEANLNASKQYIEFTASVDNWIDDQERDAVIGGTTTPADEQ